MNEPVGAAVSSSTVYVVDDDASVREALSSLLRSVGLHVETFACARDFLQRLANDAPGCLVLDIRMPDIDGLDLQRELARRGDDIPIIFITAHGDIPMTVQAMKAGAVEFLPKPFGDQQLLDAINGALERSRATWLQRSETAELRRRYASLTPREQEVLELILQGKMNKQVAAELGLSEITIKVHRRRIMDKMAAQSLPELVRMAERIRAT